MKKSILILVVVLLASLTAGAQSMRNAGSETRNIELGVTYLPTHLTSTWFQGAGAEFSVDVWRNVGVAGNFTGGYKSISNRFGQSGSSTYESFTFGPRYTYRQNKTAVYGEALFGVLHGNLNTNLAGFNNESGNDFAFQLGGGFDYSLSHKIALRVPQVHYMRAGGANVMQIGGGVVFHF